MRSAPGASRLQHVDTVHWTRFERWVVGATLVAAPVMAACVILAMVLSPHEFAESDTATGWGLWLGAALGAGMALVVLVLPQLFFGLALRSGTREKLTLAASLSPIWAFLGLQPVVAALIGGWEGLAPGAVVTAAAAGVLDCLVFVVAWRGRRRLEPRYPNRGFTRHT
jgi:hypothetical protein